MVLVDNRVFTAAGVVYSYGEAGVFTDAHELRSRKFYQVPIEALENGDSGLTKDEIKVVRNRGY